MIEINAFDYKGGGNKEHVNVYGLFGAPMDDALLVHYLSQLLMDGIAIIHEDYTSQPRLCSLIFEIHVQGALDFHFGT